MNDIKIYQVANHREQEDGTVTVGITAYEIKCKWKNQLNKREMSLDGE